MANTVLLDIHGITGGAFGPVLEKARAVERLGFHGFWGSDHQMGGSGSATHVPVLDDWTVLAALAAHTERIRLGILVTGNTYRNPALLAKIVATVDVISKGRLDFGIGTGWREPEHRAYGFAYPPFRERLERLDEAVTMFKLLCSQKDTTFKGKHYSLEDAPFEPKPVQKPHPPILMGGSGPGVLRLSAKHADEWNGMGSPAYIAEKMKVLDARCRENGRDPSTLKKSCLVLVRVFDSNAEAEHYTLEEIERLKVAGAQGLTHRVKWVAQGETLDEALRGSLLAGTPGEIVKRMRRFADIGAHRLMIGAPDMPTLQRIAKEIAPAFR